MSQRSDALADMARALSDGEWHTRVPKDGRKVGVIVHHVAAMYPIEIELARTLAAAKPIAGVSWDAVHEINAKHLREHDAATKEAALHVIQRSSRAAAAPVRALTNAELDRAAPISLSSDAPLTCQNFLEDHAVRDSYHHPARTRAALKS
jgi:hypothetical protein